jgi:hypothetical protein
VSIRCLAASLLLLAASAASAEPLRLRYEASWAGLPAGEIQLILDQGPASWRAEMQIDTRGLPRLLTRFNARAESVGELIAGAPRPEAYDVAYALRRKSKVVALRYAPLGASLVASRGPGDTSTHPQLLDAFRRDTIDPLGALAQIRRLAQAGLAVDQGFQIAAYDGKRRFDVDGRRAAEADPGSIRLKLMLRPIAGFRNPQSDEEDPEDDPRPAEMVLSDDGRAVPLRISTSIAFLPLTVRLVADCSRAPCP